MRSHGHAFSQVLERNVEDFKAAAHWKDVSNSEQVGMMEERLETLEMDLQRESKRMNLQVEKSIQQLASRLRFVEENAKDGEQAVLFGARRCFRCCSFFVCAGAFPAIAPMRTR